MTDGAASTAGTEPGQRPPRGVVFAATGRDYAALAVDGAHSVRAAIPGLAVDLYTDPETAVSDLAPGLDAAFDQVVSLPDAWRRSKIDAMARSRFARTVYLDADARAVADFSDLFELLDRFDLALAHDQWRNAEVARVTWKRDLPEAFPQFNSGVVAFRRDPAVRAFFEAWKVAVLEHDTGRDQPALRELLWETELRVATLPAEYNLMDWAAMRLWGPVHAAPRIIHSPRFHTPYTRRPDLAPVAGLDDLLGPWMAARVPALIAADHGLARRAGRTPVALQPTGAGDLLRIAAKRVARAGRRLLWRVGRRDA